MMKQKRNWWVWLCGVITALVIITGIFFVKPTMVEAATATPPTVTMLAGASARKTENEPGIKFTAKIDNYNSSYKYGMLILPESAFKLENFEGRYHAYFAENNIPDTQYADQICSVYTTKDELQEKRISFSLTDIHSYNFSMSFVGVAYTLKDGVYTYAEVDMSENARSIA